MPSQTILCVTPNAALDRTMVVPDFAIGSISRIPGAIAVPGGKGLNVLRAVEILGGRALAMGLLGGHTGRMVADMVAEGGYHAQWTRFAGETRTCTIIANAEGVSTVINESGKIEASDWQALADDITTAAAKETIAAVCLCGSLPDGAPDDAPSQLIARLNALDVPVWVDSSGLWLANAIVAKPAAIKINSEELAGAMGRDLPSKQAIIDASRELVRGGIRMVIVSLGAAGALLITEELVAQAAPPVIQPVDPIASGDCLHAGLVTALGDGASPAEALRRGVAAGTVNALYAGGAQFPYSHFQRILAQTRLDILQRL
ncbi:MAG: hexose kinase [Chloroflexi bacterium]|nr:hexose kinase [Chloroflexota bacterium]MCY3581686.1 hexose kinase [Chloroflexota bacterium]MCY3714999.1 hexose kinase [Chloroflexota bacterium]MDE2651829.1 hexose kinase [Chloroflexota bacterium]MXX82670.1 hexose kinase [Chloroflexota bacterium]